MNTSIAYACLNIQMRAEDVNPKLIAELQALLHDAAIWADADDAEVFYIESKNIIGVSILVDKDPSSILEAGCVLGMCQRSLEESRMVSVSTWLSIEASNNKIIYSPLGY